METLKNKTVLISGASIAGLSTAWWMTQLGYQVTVVESAGHPRTAGAAIDIRENAAEVAKRMGILDLLTANRLQVEQIEFKNADDVTEGCIQVSGSAADLPDDDIEIERDFFINTLFDLLKGKATFIFNDRITALNETADAMNVTFEHAAPRPFDLVFGCDGYYSGVRRLWFGPDTDYTYFMGAYGSITTVDKLLIRQKTMQMYNVPDKSIVLNAYKNKTDIILSFVSENEIKYDYRDTKQQKKMVVDLFSGQGWRSEELLKEMQQSPNFYFVKFSQIKMASWTRGRVALVGDAGYCASPAAGMGASLSVAGAGALADALAKHNGDHESAFTDYNKNLRPHIEEVQAAALRNIKENFFPKTEEAIRKRNKEMKEF